MPSLPSSSFSVAVSPRNRREFYTTNQRLISHDRRTVKINVEYRVEGKGEFREVYYPDSKPES